MRFFRRLLPAALALLSFALPGSALGQAPLSPDKAFALTVTREADGDLAFAWDIAPGHYLYRDHTVASTPGGKESLPLELAAGETKNDPGFGVVDVWHDAGRATLSAQTLTQAGELTSVNITYQGCLEDSICYPPMTRTIDVPTRPQSDVAARDADAQTAQAAAMLAIQAPGAAPAPENDEGAAVPSPVASSPAVTLDANPGFVDRLALQGGATWVLLAFFGFGVLLAFTPCVFPMYPILAGVIGRGVDGRGTRRGLMLSVAYVLGLSIAFALLGVAAAWSGQNLQMALQSVWAVGALAVVFVILAASMFGGFELQLPSTWTSRLSRDGGDGRRSLPSAAGLGFVSALIVGPCVTAPLAGALLYIAQTGDVGLGAAALFFLGMGKGVPLIVFGTVGARFLPKAGPWMDRVKMLFGFIFLGMAWWLAGRILPPTATLALGAALALGLAAALGLFQPLSPNLRSGVARVAGLAAATWGLLLLVGLSLGADDPWRPLEPLARPAGVAAAAPVETAAVVLDQTALDRAVADAGARERPALVYFTADWCVSCRVDLEIADGRVSLRRHRLIAVDAGPEDDQVAGLVETALAPERERLARVVGRTAIPLHRYAMASAPMDDVLLAAAAQAAGVDIAFSNGWRYGAPVAPGPVTLGDLYNMAPMNPPISRTTLTGAELKAMLEENLERTFAADPYEQMGGYIKRCRGLTAFVKLENPKGQRLDRLMVGDRPVQPEADYPVAFVTAQGVPEHYGRDRRTLDIDTVGALESWFAEHTPGETELPASVLII